MNYTKKIKDAVDKQTALLEKAKAENRVFSDEEKSSFDVLQAEIVSLQETAERASKAASNHAGIVDPVDVAPVVIVGKDHAAERPFANMREQLVAIKNVSTGVTDERLIKMNNALGLNVGKGSDGGFALQPSFLGMAIETALKEDPVISRVDSFAIQQGSNKVEWNDFEEESVATTVMGGVRAYWTAEATATTATKPKMKEKSLKLQKLMGVSYSSYELDTASNFSEQVFQRGFTAAILKEVGAAIVEGDGVGKPLGLNKSGSLVTVSKESAQTADTVLWQNIVKMAPRLIDTAGNVVWVVHPDVLQQLYAMYFDPATANNMSRVFIPGGANGSTTPFMLGYPVIVSQNCAAIGDLGDILFTNLSDYLMVYRGGIASDVSIHVQFLTAENTYRFIYQMNGMPKREKPLTIKNSALQRSNIVTLQAR
jgi:HK97 family phage major capsid protein